MGVMDALSRLLDDHGGALRLYARQWLGDAAAAEDAVQEALVACWRRDPGLSATLLPQVFVAVRHAALNLGRGERRRDSRERSVAADQQPCFHCPQAADDLREEVERALARLPGAQREVVTLHLWGGLTFAEIGEVLGCNANTAASRYRYALAALRDQLSLPEVRP
jgi:RNA polymerase sigma-70 factor (ECF subfamily)